MILPLSFCIISFFILYFQDRLLLSDFKVYYGASRDLFYLGVDYIDFGYGRESTGLVYDKPYGLGTGFYKYAPVFLYFITPFSYFFQWENGKDFFILSAVFGMWLRFLVHEKQVS